MTWFSGRRRVMTMALVVAILGTGVWMHESAEGVEQLTAVSPDGGGRTDRPIASLRELNDAFVELAAAVNPAVVTVFTETVLRVRQSPFPFFEYPFNGLFDGFFESPRQSQPREREFRQRGLGSGVVVTSDGYIITNNHVIAGADTINVRFMDGTTMPAMIVGTDDKTDIAVLKVEANDLTTIRIGDSDDLRVGEWVLAIGSPLSPSLAHSVTSGIVSAKGRSNVGLADYEDFIQTDAAINPGNSGGPLINLEGELVGINTAIASRSGGYQGVGFAIPSNMARRVMQALIEHGVVVRGWLGVYIQNIDEALATAMDLERGEGALVADVAEGGPADKAGIEQGDVIVAIDGKPVDSSTQLRNEIASRPPDSKVTLAILRNGKTRKIRVTLDELPTNQAAARGRQRLEDLLGLAVAPLDGESARKYRLNRSLDGVVITSLVQNGPAHRAGLDEGDLIVAVNRAPVENPEQFNEHVRDLKKGSTVLLRVVRGNHSFFVGIKIPG